MSHSNEDVSIHKTVNHGSPTPRHLQYRTLKTIALYCAFLGFGLSFSVVAPSIASMEILLDTDTKSFSAAFSGNALGYLAGALLCGFIYDRLNKELLFVLALSGISGSILVAPFSTHLYMFVGACIVLGFATSLLDTGAQSYLLKLWEGHKYKRPVLQTLHTIWSVGSTVGPFILKPFLVDIPQHHKLNTSLEDSIGTRNTSYTQLGYLIAKENTSSYHHDVNTDVSLNFTGVNNESLKEEVAVVRIGYVIIGGLVFLCSFLFIVIFFLMKPSCTDPSWQKKTKEEKVAHSKSFRRFRIIMLLFLSLITFTYQIVMSITAFYFAAFVVKGLGWPNNYGALTMTGFWAAYGVSRLCSIPLSTVVSPRNMFLFNLALIIVGLVLLCFVPRLEVITWAGVVITGFGLGPKIASLILWVENYIEFTGVASSVLFSSVSVSGILSPLATGYFFEEFSHMFVVYIALGGIILEFCAFITACVYAQRNHLHAHEDPMDLPDTEMKEILKPLHENENDVC